MPDKQRARSRPAPRKGEPRRPTEKWRRLPERVDPEDMIESVPDDPPPIAAEPAGDPDTAWMLRYS